MLAADSAGIRGAACADLGGGAGRRPGASRPRRFGRGAEMSADFLCSSGFRLLDRDGSGGLAVTDAFLRAYLARPELRPVEGSCAEEVALHGALAADPRLPVDAGRLARIADPDAREN